MALIETSLCLDTITDYTVRNLPPEVLTSLIILLGGALVSLLVHSYRKDKRNKSTIEEMKKEKSRKEIDCIGKKDTEQSTLIREIQEDMKLKNQMDASWQKEVTEQMENMATQQKNYQEKVDRRLSELDRKVQEMMNDLDLSKESDIVILRDRINHLSVELIKEIEDEGATEENINQMQIVQEMFRVYRLKGGNSGVDSVVLLAQKKLEQNHARGRG